MKFNVTHIDFEPIDIEGFESRDEYLDTIGGRSPLGEWEAEDELDLELVIQYHYGYEVEHLEVE